MLKSFVICIIYVFYWVITCAFKVSLEEKVCEGACKVVVRSLGELDTTQTIPLNNSMGPCVLNLYKIGLCSDLFICLFSYLSFHSERGPCLSIT